MKRAWRFVKWILNKCGWFEVLLFTSAFCLAAGLTAGEGNARNIFWGIAAGVNVLAMLVFMWWGARSIWRDFVKHDEKVFDILKDKNHGQ